MKLWLWLSQWRHLLLILICITVLRMNFDPLLRRGSSFPPNFLGQKAPKKVKISTLNLHLFFRYFSYCRAKGSSIAASFLCWKTLKTMADRSFFPSTHSLFKSRRMLEAKGEKGSQVTWESTKLSWSSTDLHHQINQSKLDRCKAFFFHHPFSILY